MRDPMMKLTPAQRRNQILLVLEGTLFWSGLAFLQGDTVITKFMIDTTGSAAWVGLAATLRTVAPMVGQFVMGMFIHRIPKQSRAMTLCGFLCRPLFLLMVPFLASGLMGLGAATAFLVIYALFFLLDGGISLLWLGVCARTLPNRHRGAAVTLQQTFGGLSGFFAGLIVSRILGGSLSFEDKYLIVFLIASAILVLDAVALALIRDEPHKHEPHRPIQPLQYAKALIPLFVRNRPIRTLMLARSMHLISLVAAPLNFVFGQKAGHLDEAQLAALIFMPVIGQTLAGVIWSQACRRLGYPLVMLMAQCLGVLCALMNLLCFVLAGAGKDVMIPLSLTMILTALNMPSAIAFTQHMIAMVDEDQRPSYLVVTGLVILPLLFGTYLAGIAAESLGYLPIYWVMLVCSLFGVFLVHKNFVGKRARYAEPFP